MSFEVPDIKAEPWLVGFMAIVSRNGLGNSRYN